ncbi:hypothetical protein LX36DRAFT_310142 [Colletotrichum falcatum]|nr:hypothetical protein LX36DRAFT_310142 [Colletotrichum falcatum]
MAESLAALGVAANIVQFLELGLKATVSIVEIYRSVSDDGWTARNADLDSIAKDLRDRCDRLKDDADVKLDLVMVRLLQRCIDTADELSLELRGLVRNIATRHQKWSKFKVSLAAYFKRGKINEIQARLGEIKTHVFEHLQILLHENRKSLSRSMRSLEDASESWNRATEKRLDALAHDLSNICESQSAAEASTQGLRIFIETWARISEEAQNQATLVAILKSLQFAQIKERQSEIPEAHRRTFEWVFGDDSPVYLSAWLRESAGLFWITGKPGSGKSTLMKFILRHEQTMLLAGHWASPQPLIVASHFFWSAGTAIQKSQEGLLRTLLFQVLVNCPGIISLVCPTRYSNSFKRLESWSIEELSEAFGRLKDIQPLPSRILMLIDGLDEYNGNLGNLVQFIRSTSESPHIKICCASRPWPVFSNGFDDVSGRMHMHELTANDMMRYIRDTLGQHSHFSMLKQSREAEAAKLAREIADKSEGVFFWVSLVVKSLLRGLDSGDDLAILQQRLSEFPSDLDKFFQRMLDSIDGVYKSNAAMVFSMLLLANSSLPLIVFIALESFGHMGISMILQKGHETRPRVSGMSFLRSFNAGREPPGAVFLKLLLQDARSFSERLINSRLPERVFSVTQVNEKKHQILSQCRDLVQAWEVAGPSEHQYDFRLGFLHRTVVGFLERDAETRWQSTLPFKRYLLARSYLSFVDAGEESQHRARDFVLRFVYTLQEADLQEMIEIQDLVETLLHGLSRWLESGNFSIHASEVEEMGLLLMQTCGRIISVAKTPGSWDSVQRLVDPWDDQTIRVGKQLWFLRGSGYVEVGDWAQVSWTRVVDLEVLDYLLSHYRHSIRHNYPDAFSTFLVAISNGSETRPRNDLQVCKMLIEHDFAGSVERDKHAMSPNMNPAEIVSARLGDTKLTKRSTMKWLRNNRIFLDSGLQELEEAFPLTTR